MKKPFWKIALVFAWPIGWLQAQEVITNDEGQKIVVEASGWWHYFLPEDTLNGTSRAKANLSVADFDQKKQQALVACERKEKEISLLLVKARVDLVETQLALQAASGKATSRQREQVEHAEQLVQRLAQELDENKERMVFLQNIANLPAAAYERKLEKWEEDHSPKKVNQASGIEAKPATVKPEDAELANGLLFLPPQTPCAGGAETTDKQLGVRQWETAATHFFSHTDKAIEQQFPKRDFVTCHGHLTAIQGGKKYLDLELAVASIKAPQIFGTMPKDEFLEITLLNGETLRLFNSMPNSGQWVASQDAFVYVGRYALGYKEEKMLRNSEIDTVLVRWSLVQDKYEVYETDFFMRQFDCLDALFSEEN